MTNQNKPSNTENPATDKSVSVLPIRKFLSMGHDDQGRFIIMVLERLDEAPPLTLAFPIQETQDIIYALQKTLNLTLHTFVHKHLSPTLDQNESINDINLHNINSPTESGITQDIHYYYQANTHSFQVQIEPHIHNTEQDSPAVHPTKVVLSEEALVEHIRSCQDLLLRFGKSSSNPT